MEVSLGVLADGANLSREGKLNIMGIFEVIHASSFPVIHPIMHLVIRFEASAAEARQTKKISIKFMDEDGKIVLEVGGDLTLGEAQPGERIKVDHILSFAAVKFEKPGRYEFKILVNGEPRKDVPLKVVEANPQGSGEGRG